MDWINANDKLSKEFKFSSFSEAVDFINNLAPVCDMLGHHPDIHIYYNKIVFELQTHDVGNKVTEKDLNVAKEIDRLFNL